MSATAPSRAIVDLEAYAHNLDMVRRLVGPNTGVVAVVKAGAYGHGLLPVAKRAAAWGAAMLGVATIDEGIQIRNGGIGCPVLVLVQPGPDALSAAIENSLTLMLSDSAIVEALGEVAAKGKRVVPIHCKVDSGMGRQGFAMNSAGEDLQQLTRISHIDIQGIATHFPVADRSEDTFTYNQIRAFRQLLKQIDKFGIPYEVAHAANSAAIVNYHGSVFDMVRPGLMTYGVWPTQTPPAQQLLRPVLRWETRVIQVRELDAGASVGYGRTYTTPRAMRAAVVPVGYADGYRHSLSNRADVLIRGQRCRVRGSVCMDQIVVDVSMLSDVRVGDTVTLIGQDGEETVTPEELARHAQTIPYEVLTGIGARVPREYT